MAQSIVCPTLGASRDIVTIRANAIEFSCNAHLPANSMWLGSVDEIVASWCGQSGPIIAQSIVRPTQEASCKIAAASLFAAIANLCDLWVELAPSVDIFTQHSIRGMLAAFRCIHHSLFGTHSTVHLEQTYSNFYTAIGPI